VQKGEEVFTVYAWMGTEVQEWEVEPVSAM